MNTTVCYKIIYIRCDPIITTTIKLKELVQFICLYNADVYIFKLISCCIEDGPDFENWCVQLMLIVNLGIVDCGIQSYFTANRYYRRR